VRRGVLIYDDGDGDDNDNDDDNDILVLLLRLGELSNIDARFRRGVFVGVSTPMPPTCL